jgi:hypothetical protein
VAASAYFVFGIDHASGEADAPELVFNEERPAGEAVPFTAEQCDLADGMLAASYTSMSALMEATGQDEALESLTREYTRSLAWVSNGCPPDPILGFYPGPDGSGGTWRLMEHQLFGMSPVMTFTEE